MFAARSDCDPPLPVTPPVPLPWAGRCEPSPSRRRRNSHHFNGYGLLVSPTRRLRTRGPRCERLLRARDLQHDDAQNSPGFGPGGTAELRAGRDGTGRGRRRRGKGVGRPTRQNSPGFGPGGTAELRAGRDGTGRGRRRRGKGVGRPTRPTTGFGSSRRRPRGRGHRRCS
jgi:hypothetical protein